MMIRFVEKKPLAGIFILVAIMFLPHLHLLPVTIMEARNFITVREMINDGNWVLTTMNGLPRYEKPPLPTWLSAFSSLMFGVNSLWALRLPAVLMVMILSVTVYFFSKALNLDKSLCVLNALISATSFYIAGIIIEAPWDIFTHGFMLIAILYIYHFLNEEKKSLKNMVLAGIFGGFSFLSKGPISMYALLLPFLLAFGVSHTFGKLRRKANQLMITVGLMLLVGGWWYIYVHWQDPETFFEIAQRETSNWGSYNIRPFYYYWSFFAQSGLWTIPAFISLLYPYMRDRVANLRAYRFSLLWTLISVVMLSLIPEKKTRYLMPVLIPLAINTGFYVEYVVRRFGVMKLTERLPVYINFGLISVAGIAIPFLMLIFLSPLRENLFWGWLSFVALPFIGVNMLYHLVRKRIKMVVIGAIVLYALVFLLIPPLFKTQFFYGRQKVKAFKKMVNEEKLQVFAYKYIAPEVIWWYGEKIPYVESSVDLLVVRDKIPVVLSNVDIHEDCFLGSKQYEIQYRGKLDINSLGSSRNRLVSRFYIFKKKD
ncbi:ArnT family glycosyltransferase [Thermophagus sp. OGC60D27]|uniref:ArnT family glycosyltransferase n=1 Tax=Thermophagus sp. OGC60D27 TaxID=3458415 RepID=UPI0040378E9D